MGKNTHVLYPPISSNHRNLPRNATFIPSRAIRPPHVVARKPPPKAQEPTWPRRWFHSWFAGGFEPKSSSSVLKQEEVPPSDECCVSRKKHQDVGNDCFKKISHSTANVGVSPKQKTSCVFNGPHPRMVVHERGVQSTN